MLVKGKKEGAVGRRNEGRTFGARLRELRQAKERSLRKFAEEIGISPTYLSKIERDEFVPPPEARIREMAKALGADAEELIALAGRIPDEVKAILKEQPLEMATFLRTVRGLSPEALRQLGEHAAKMKKRSASSEKR
jgi:transcriptional regulator with XRE-family HTH domain